MRDRRLGGYDFCKPLGVFIHRGFAPRDEKTPAGLQKP